MVLFPIGGADIKSSRFPLVTVSIIFLNFVFFFTVHYLYRQDRQQLNFTMERYGQLFHRQIIDRAFRKKIEIIRQKRWEAFFGSRARISAFTDMMVEVAEAVRESAEETFVRHHTDFMNENVYNLIGLRDNIQTSWIQRFFSFLTQSTVLAFLGNLFFLFLICNRLESEMGRLLLLGAYFVLGLASTLLFTSLFGEPTGEPVIGGTAVLAGLVGCYLVISMRGPYMIGWVRTKDEEGNLVGGQFGLPSWLLIMFWIYWMAVIILGQVELGDELGAAIKGASQERIFVGPDWRVCLLTSIAGIWVAVFLMLAGLVSGRKELQTNIAGEVETLEDRLGAYRRESIYRKILLARENTDTDTEAELLLQLVEKYPELPGPHLELSEIYRTRRDETKFYESVRAACRAGIKMNQPDIYLELYDKLGQAKIDPDLGPADMLVIASQLERRGQLAEATKAYLYINEKYSDDPTAVKGLFKYGQLSLEKLSQPRLALAAFRKALNLARGDHFWEETIKTWIQKAEKELEHEMGGTIE